MKVRVFYGWYIVAAGVVITALIGGVTFYGFTALVNPISAAFGWSFAQISLAMSLRAVLRGILNPFIGKAVDRWSAKWLILIAVLIMGLGYFWLSKITNLAMFYIIFLIIAFGSSLGVGIAPTATVVRWFKRNVGKASGLLAMGIGLGGLLTPVLVKIIDTYGWQNAVIILAVAIWVIGTPLSFVFRNRPEDYGLFPDGKPPDDSPVSDSPKADDFSLGVKEALKKRAFWQIGLAYMLQNAGVDAAIIHMIPYLTSLGIERTTAGLVAMFVPLVSLPARFTFGWLADIFQKKYVLAVSILLTSAGLFLFSLIRSDSFWLIVLFVIVFSLGIAGIRPLRPPIVREYFGTKNFGTILGLELIFLTIATVVGPPMAGWVYDTRGVYDPIWLILSGVAMIGVILMLTMPPAPRPSRGSSAA